MTTSQWNGATERYNLDSSSLLFHSIGPQLHLIGHLVSPVTKMAEARTEVRLQQCSLIILQRGRF